LDAPALGVDARQRVYVQLGVLLAGDRGEIEEVRLGEIKGRCHREWLVNKLAVRCNQVHLHDDLEERAQRQQRLNSRNAAATDNDTPRISGSVPLSHRQLERLARESSPDSAGLAESEVRKVIAGG
jgi:hypothetical protein